MRKTTWETLETYKDWTLQRHSINIGRYRICRKQGNRNVVWTQFTSGQIAKNARSYWKNSVIGLF